VDGISWKGITSLLLLLGLVSLWPASVLAAPDAVESVSVSIISETATPPPRIAKRMTASISAVGENVLLGKKVTEVRDSQAAYEKIIQEVFDRVLVGYSVQEVAIHPGVDTTIVVTLTPWGDVVREVTVDMEYNNLSPGVSDLVRQDMGDVTGKVRDILIGLPIDAVDWGGALSKTVLRDYLEAQLPEFRYGFDIVPGAKTTVRISLAPQGTLIQDVQFSLRSKTIPNVLLMAARPEVEAMGNELRGLPVAFVERHRDYFTTRIGQTAANLPVVRKYGLTLKPVLEVGSDARITLFADTHQYKLTLKGYLDMGRQQDNTEVRLHVGKYLGEREEAFMEVHFLPSDVSWEFLPGIAHRVGTDTTVGVKYSITHQQYITWLHQPLSNRLSFRLERTPATGYNEMGLRYKLHDFVSAEYVRTNHESWLRLIADL
jgi:hypothetical protein